jgi:hypothetical protein
VQTLITRYLKGLDMGITKIRVVAVAFASAAVFVGPAEVAHADTEYWFTSPSGNIGCVMGDVLKGGVNCDIKSYTYARPPDPDHCTGRMNWGNRFALNPGQAPTMPCHGDTVFDASLDRTLNYGQKQSYGPITCDSEQNGMTCTDTNTGRYFWVSADSYTLH